MQRRAFLVSLMGALTAGLPAFADYATQVEAQLTQQGFSNIKVTKTWLGRIHILAYRNGGVREIVLNPRTGEILRDLYTAANGSDKSVSIIDSVNSGGGNQASASTGSSGDTTSAGTSGDTTSGGETSGSSTSSSGTSTGRSFHRSGSNSEHEDSGGGRKKDN